MADREKIKAFVQGTLGCGCAEEVFRLIEDRRETLDGRPYTRINTGNRLLIYVFDITGSDLTVRDAEKIMLAGKRERDSSGFNRFRLVLAAQDTSFLEIVSKGLKEWSFLDDRLHVHVVKADEVAFLK